MRMNRDTRKGDGVSSPHRTSSHASAGRDVMQSYSRPESRTAAELQGSVGNQAALQLIRNPEADEADADVSVPQQRMADPNRLPLEVQAKMESAMNADFSDVTVHPNSSSATRAGALAYAQGSDIHFAPGQYDPFSQKGQQMIGHELAHVVQQKAGRVAPTGKTESGALLNDSPALESEADAMGAKAASTPIPASDAIQRTVDRSGSAPTAYGSQSLLMQQIGEEESLEGEEEEPIQRIREEESAEGEEEEPIQRIREEESAEGEAEDAPGLGAILEREGEEAEGTD